MSTDLSDTKLTPAVLKELDLLSLERLLHLYGPGQTVTEFAQPRGYWRPGDGRPQIALDEDPAACQAAGRCVASRTRYGDIFAGRSIHPARCGWCDYPVDVLLVALDHATFVSRYILAEYVWWGAKDGSYARATDRAGTYENPRWAAFFDQDRALRTRAIDHAASREPEGATR